MNIDGLGDAIVQQLLAQHLIHDVADIYGLTKEELVDLEALATNRQTTCSKPSKRANPSAWPGSSLPWASASSAPKPAASWPNPSAPSMPS